ncbi:helix-turn-helix domain-containing protein [Paenibacillus xanthanilyticus]|uniref:Helix-turn-helix domain-containing protein n=1 Tax=Paenibacillus xanthanilyticus TaxID=1783531 RepID=A0ABV8K7T0_9BACL
MNTIGNRIKAVRKAIGYNQVEFANKIGVSQGTLSELEQDKYKPSTDTVIALNENFKTDLNWLLTGTSDVLANKMSLVENNDMKFIEHLRKLKREDQDDILTFLEIKLNRANKH